MKTGYLGWRNIQSTENLGYPNQQQYRYRSLPVDASTGTCNEQANYDGCFTRPDSVLVYDYPNTTASGEWYSSAYFNDKITVTPKFTLERRRALGSLFELPARAGQPGHRPVRDDEHLRIQGRG